MYELVASYRYLITWLIIKCSYYSVLQKYIDAFASALGFFLIGFDHLSKYESPQCLEPKFLEISDPVLWFFKVLATQCVLQYKYK